MSHKHRITVFVGLRRGAGGANSDVMQDQAAWVLGIDFAFVDRRFGADNVNRLLEDGRDYADPPQLDTAGRLGAALSWGSAEGGALSLRIRLRDDALEMSCACSRGRPYVCEHVTRVLVDLAAHERLRAVLAAATAPSTMPPLGVTVSV
jgi:hypothetical protein